MIDVETNRVHGDEVTPDVLVRGAREARDEEGPRSAPTDFVAPVSSGRYRWRGADESPEEFRARVKHDEAAEREP